MLAARMTLPHFSVSSAMSLPKSAGESVSTVAPEVGKLCLDLGIGKARAHFPIEHIDDCSGWPGHLVGREPLASVTTLVLGRAGASISHAPF